MMSSDEVSNARVFLNASNKKLYFKDINTYRNIVEGIRPRNGEPLHRPHLLIIEQENQSLEDILDSIDANIMSIYFLVRDTGALATRRFTAT